MLSNTSKVHVEKSSHKKPTSKTKIVAALKMRYEELQKQLCCLSRNAPFHDNCRNVRALIG